MSAWRDCKKILCVRPDNMGDLLMSAPAISALKETFACNITVLTSSMAKDVAQRIPAIDEILVWDMCWMKGSPRCRTDDIRELVQELKQKHFDGTVIFTVFSQNPLPTALLLTMAEIPLRLAYCRENPYELLSHWIPEEEPYNFVRHQVRRDLDLVGSIGAHSTKEDIVIEAPETGNATLHEKLRLAGVDILKPWLILHPGVSELKREYPRDLWIAAGKRIAGELNYQLIITGGTSERTLAEAIQRGIGESAYNLAGSLTLDEFIALIKLSPLIISVNTGSVHVASAVKTPVIVLYALTNPQHPPWKSVGKVLPFSVPVHLQSRNEVLRYVQQNIFKQKTINLAPDEIFLAAFDILENRTRAIVPELILP